jgi:hypothetical protein
MALSSESASVLSSIDLFLARSRSTSPSLSRSSLGAEEDGRSPPSPDSHRLSRQVDELQRLLYKSDLAVSSDRQRPVRPRSIASETDAKQPTASTFRTRPVMVRYGLSGAWGLSFIRDRRLSYVSCVRRNVSMLQAQAAPKIHLIPPPASSAVVLASSLAPQPNLRQSPTLSNPSIGSQMVLLFFPMLSTYVSFLSSAGYLFVVNSLCLNSIGIVQLVADRMTVACVCVTDLAMSTYRFCLIDPLYRWTCRSPRTDSQ